jgi:hypothetical protein
MIKKMKMKSRSAKTVPQRTCVACRSVKDKPELIRLVRTSDKIVEVDLDGKKPGRGAYLCRTADCWQAGFRGGRLEHTLKTALTGENRERLLKFGIEYLVYNNKE